MKNINEYEATAKFELSDAQRQWASACSDLLTASFQALNAVDTSAVEPLVTVLDIRNVMRDDVAAEKIVSREELLSNAPEQYNGYFQVPKTLE